jgi:hypothetical protein
MSTSMLSNLLAVLQTDPIVLLNPNPETGLRQILRYQMTKNVRFHNKKNDFFYGKLHFIFHSGDAFSPQKRISSTSKHKSLHCGSFFTPPESGSASSQSKSMRTHANPDSLHWINLCSDPGCESASLKCRSGSCFSLK